VNTYCKDFGSLIRPGDWLLRGAGRYVISSEHGIEERVKKLLMATWHAEEVMKKFSSHITYIHNMLIKHT
jgi:hypothetical protein